MNPAATGAPSGAARSARAISAAPVTSAAPATSAALATSAVPATSAAPARVERIVVRVPGDAAVATRIARRLPDRLQALLDPAAAGDERGLRALIERAVQEARR